MGQALRNKTDFRSHGRLKQHEIAQWLPSRFLDLSLNFETALSLR
jgi:hypothetical protein